jgi:hypothetical protein
MTFTRRKQSALDEMHFMGEKGREIFLAHSTFFNFNERRKVLMEAESKLEFCKICAHKQSRAKWRAG